MKIALKQDMYSRLSSKWMCLYMPRDLQACLGTKTEMQSESHLAAVCLETAQPIDPRSQEKTDSPDIIQIPEKSSGSWEGAP